MLSLSSSVLVNGLPGTLLSDAELFTVELLLYFPRSSPSIVCYPCSICCWGMRMSLWNRVSRMGSGSAILPVRSCSFLVLF